jgi:multicomponent Na+:H+ antiporter subunit C
MQPISSRYANQVRERLPDYMRPSAFVTLAMAIALMQLVLGVLILIGLWGLLTHRNILRIIISFSLMGTGTHIVTVAIGYVRNGTAPIIDRTLDVSEAVSRVVDPIPSALVVTAIVIGMAVTAIMLAFAIRLYDSKKTLSIDAFTDSKW